MATSARASPGSRVYYAVGRAPRCASKHLVNWRVTLQMINEQKISKALSKIPTDARINEVYVPSAIFTHNYSESTQKYTLI